MGYIGAIDQGTSGTRAILFDSRGQTVGRAREPVTAHRPEPTQVTYDPTELATAVTEAFEGALADAGCDASAIDALGVTGQRATAVAWDAASGEPVGPALSWEDARTKDGVRALEAATVGRILEATGLFPVSGYSASKFEWLLDGDDNRERARAGEVLVGTLTSWLLYRLTGRHVIDATDAAATMLCDVRTLEWDDHLLEAFGVPAACLPEIVPSSHPTAFGTTGDGTLGADVPVTASLGDQQAALLGQGCRKAGDAAFTLGSGGFLKVVTDGFVADRGGLVSTVALQRADDTRYMLEAPIPTAGSAIEWLVEVGLLGSVERAGAVAESVDREPQVFLVPAFRGLGTPYWDETATGTVVGVDRTTRAEHLVRATLDAIAYRARDVVEALPGEVAAFDSLRIDGGLAASRYLCQRIADVLEIPVCRPTQEGITALGAARAAAMGLDRETDLQTLDQRYHRFEPTADADTDYGGWQRAVEVARGWNS